MSLARYTTSAQLMRDRAAYRVALAAISEREGVSVRDVMARRKRSMAAAKLHNQALYLAVVVCGVPGRAVARAAGVSESYVRRVLRLIEEARDDAALDRRLDELELRIGR